MCYESSFSFGFRLSGKSISKRAYYRIEKDGLNVEFEVEADVFYDNQRVGTRRLDLLVEGKVLIELKAFTVLEKKHVNQILNYLNAFNIEIGLLLNFGAERLQFHRYFNQFYKEKT